MTTAHTPGPWRIGDAGCAVYGPKAELGAPECICEVTRKAGASPRQQANARLIAAAPELLAALERIADETCDHGPGFCPRDYARAAIRAANGE